MQFEGDVVWGCPHARYSSSNSRDGGGSRGAAHSPARVQGKREGHSQRARRLPRKRGLCGCEACVCPRVCECRCMCVCTWVPACVCVRVCTCGGTLIRSHAFSLAASIYLCSRYHCCHLLNLLCTGSVHSFSFALTSSLPLHLLNSFTSFLPEFSSASPWKVPGLESQARLRLRLSMRASRGLRKSRARARGVSWARPSPAEVLCTFIG